MAVKTVKPNLFTNAKKVESGKTKKSNILHLPVPEELEEHHDNYVESKLELETLESKYKIAETAIKAKVPEIFLDQYRKHKRCVRSFKLGDIGVSVQDKYPKIGEDAGKLISKSFPDTVEQETEYTFNQEILQKNIEAISDALQSAKISKEDLQNLIVKKEVYHVKKGTIQTLLNYGDKMDELYQFICPIISMR
jgi:hypothetical protein